VEPDTSISAVAGKARTGLIGTLIAFYAFFDVIPIAVVVIALTAWFERPLILFGITAVALLVINIASCAWVQRHWDAWVAGNGKRVENRLEKMRKSRLMKHPVAWITRGSDWWYALATAIVNPIIVVAAARLLGGEPISERRIMIASVAYAIPMAAVFTYTGYAIGEGIRAA
jgi:hypothetical protein